MASAAEFSSQAIGNNSNWSSATYRAMDGINFQSNLGTAQISVSNITRSSFGGNLNVGSVSVGNVANIGNRP